MSIDAMKQALEALENGSPDQYPEGAGVFYNAITALRLAIEQAERQEPVVMWEPQIATIHKDGVLIGQRIKRTHDGPWEDCAAPPQQEKQEPVAWIYNCQLYWENPSDDAKPLYTAPPQRQPLTEEEIADIAFGFSALEILHDDYAFARAIERAHGIGGGHE